MRHVKLFKAEGQTTPKTVQDGSIVLRDEETGSERRYALYNSIAQLMTMHIRIHVASHEYFSSTNT